MELALEQARLAYQEDEVPVGAVLVDARGSLLAAAHNQPLGLNDPSAHAEILALRRAGLIKKNYRLPGAVLVTTLEPCLMCAGALIQARISGLIFAARDAKAGAIVSRLGIFDDYPWLNHRFWIEEGILGEESRELLRQFFAAKRK
ncbi:MAG: nucleoside deaminase [Desulfohalobiaceae bacterium]|nr:nucleoside deaminase [Desulfohalobiaceae bacterium]